MVDKEKIAGIVFLLVVCFMVLVLKISPVISVIFGFIFLGVSYFLIDKFER